MFYSNKNTTHNALKYEANFRLTDFRMRWSERTLTSRRKQTTAIRMKRPPIMNIIIPTGGLFPIIDAPLTKPLQTNTNKKRLGTQNTHFASDIQINLKWVHFTTTQYLFNASLEWAFITAALNKVCPSIAVARTQLYRSNDSQFQCCGSQVQYDRQTKI